MILVIRTQLWLTNYPQLGGGGLHIAHLLYGGIFMVISIWIGLIYLNRGGRTASAIIGGIGFGFFIDELGKFITSDNNYFFKPAAGIIYIVFIILFLIIRELSRRQVLDQKTALANAMAFLPATVSGEFRRDELEVANQLLDQSDPDDPRVARIREYFKEAALAPDKKPSRIAQAIDRIHQRITRITEKPNFGKWVIRIVIAWGVISLLGILDLQYDLGIETQTSNQVPSQSPDFLSIARTLSILDLGDHGRHRRLQDGEGRASGLLLLVRPGLPGLDLRHPGLLVRRSPVRCRLRSRARRDPLLGDLRTRVAGQPAEAPLRRAR